MKVKKRTAIYLRVSTKDQSSDMQLAQLRKFAELYDYEILDTYSDSATGRNTDRPQFQEMMKWAEYGKYEVILIWKLDRFSRSLEDLIATTKRLADCDVSLVSMQDHFDMDSITGRLLFRILGSFAQFESETISLRVKTGLEAKKGRGERVGRERTICRSDVVKLYERHQSMGRVAQELGISKASVSRIINDFRREKEAQSGQSLTTEQSYII